MRAEPIVNKIVKWIVRGVVFVLLAALIAVAATYLFMILWNWLMPTLFGLRLITFWQALGLLFLCRFLFGGFRGRYGRRGHWGWRRRMMERWEQMTPEEREKFRACMRGGCGPFGSSPAAPKA